MKEYLKMSDVFVVDGDADFAVLLPMSVKSEFDDCSTPHEYAAHAINSHDELVAEVERLKYVLSQCADALYIADSFCSNHTADDCDDSVAIPISDALLAARKHL